MSTTFITATPEQRLRSRCRATWESGDFGIIARYTASTAAEFRQRLPITRGVRFLDLACGTGNLALEATRAGALVHGLDIAANLVGQARSRAAAENLPVEFIEGDVDQLPFASASFDIVASLFGVMFSPDPPRATAEMLRVCRPGGLVALACWTPEGVIGEHLRTIARHVPPPADCPSPLLWGDEATIRSRLGDGVTDLRLIRRNARLHYPFPPAQTVAFVRQFYGPTVRAFATLDPAGQTRLAQDLTLLLDRHNRHEARDRETLLDAEYLEVFAARR